MTNKISFLLLFFIFSACNKGLIFKQFYSFPSEKWSLNDTVVFQVPVNPSDTGFYNIFFDIYHTDKFPYKNLWLFVKIVNPKGITEIDTVNVFLATDKGYWLGKKFGKTYHFRYLFRENVGFVGTGVYKFFIVQGMRDTSKVFIKKIGLEIEKFKANGKK